MDFVYTKNRLALNPDKSEAVLFSTSQHAKGVSVIATIDVAGPTVALPRKIKLLGVTLDGTLISMTRLRTYAERHYFTFVRYVIFVFL